MEVTAYWEGGYRVRVPVRGFEIRTDEPRQDGGEDTGPTPTELLLAALACCYAMAVRFVAKKEGVHLPDLRVHVTGSYDGLRFGRIRVEVASSVSAVRHLVDKANRYCYVSNTLCEPLELEVAAVDPIVTPPPPLPG